MKRPVIDPLRLQDHALCMLCYESTDQDRRECVTVKLGKCKSPTSMVDHMQKYHEEEWAGLHKVGKQQEIMKSFTTQHSTKKAQSTPGAAHAASTVGEVVRPDSLSGAVKHAASETRFAHVKDIFQKQDTGNPVATEGAQGSTEGAQGSMRAHFKSKEQGWDKNKTIHGRRSWHQPAAVFREMIGALNTNTQIPSATGIKRIMENMRVDLNEELRLLMHGEFVCVFSDSWTSAAGNTYLGITYHWIDADWNLNNMTVDCELLQVSTVGEELAERVPEAWDKSDVAGVVTHVTDCEPVMVKMGRLVKEKVDLAWIGCSDHRLEKTAEQFYKHEGVLHCCERAKKVVTCIHTSSQVEIPSCPLCCSTCVAAVIGLCRGCNLSSLMCTFLHIFRRN